MKKLFSTNNNPFFFYKSDMLKYTYRSNSEILNIVMAKVKEFIENLTDQSGARERAKKEVTELVEKANLKLNDMENRLREMFRNKEQESQMEIAGDRMAHFPESTERITATVIFPRR